MFADAKDTRLVMEALGNLVTGTEIGMILSTTNDWFAVFEFDAIGYVKDNEKSDLNAGKLLNSLQKGQVEANKQRRAAGMADLCIDGWFKEPYFNDKTKNLEWCTKLHEAGTEDQFANHNIRILGRRGITRITLVAGLDMLDDAIPELATILDSYQYKPGEGYAEYRKGDAIAKYGLTALVAGGAAAVAFKTGLFRHLWKLIVVACAAIGGLFKKFRKQS
jgi:uncharacterized membrane-anchored protein